MIDKRKHLSRSPMHFQRVSPCYAFLICVMNLFIRLRPKNTTTERLPQPKQWRHEKVLHLGLATYSEQKARHPIKEIHFSDWHSEKALSFGLSQAQASPKKMPPVQTKTKHLATAINIASPLKNTTSSPTKQKVNPVVLNQTEPLDDFLKILGYE